MRSTGMEAVVAAMLCARIETNQVCLVGACSRIAANKPGELFCSLSGVAIVHVLLCEMVSSAHLSLL